MKRIILVSNRLPVSISDDDPPTVQRSAGGLAIALDTIATAHTMTWVGWGGNRRPLTRKRREQLALPPYLKTVDIPPRTLQRYYDSFSNGTLWPLLHSMPPNHTPSTADWQAVETVVERFANAIVSILTPDDRIWVHDFHLLLLIGALRRRGVRNKIGFFFHTPFPPTDIWRMLAGGNILLRSVLQADALGFQTARDRDHFLATVRGLPGRITLPRRIGVFPIGIDFATYDQAHADPDVRQHGAAIKHKVQGTHVVLSVSRLDYTKGILEQLRGFEEAVLAHGLQHICYRLIVAPSREARIEYRTLERQIERQVARTNARFARHQLDARVWFEYRNHGFAELMAWFESAQTLLITPYVDGMNLVVKEYIAARQEPGGVVLSRFAGAAEQLPAAHLVDPHDTHEIAAALAHSYHSQNPNAPQTAKFDLAARWRALRRNVQTEDIFAWANTFLNTLEMS